jgi:DNA-binding response OmpR family regulator
MPRILIVEDSGLTRSLYTEQLGASHTLVLASTMMEGLARGSSEDFDLIIIDLNLPDGDGFELCRQLTSARAGGMPPFFFVSGRYDLQDKLTGFALGAEDYIVKPFEPKELQARVEIRLRRHSNIDVMTDVAKEFGLSIDYKSLRALITEAGATRDLNLTPNEFRLLCVLLNNIGKTLTRAEILTLGWGNGVHVLERTIDRHISALRRKLGAGHISLEAVPGVGYRWNLASQKTA